MQSIQLTPTLFALIDEAGAIDSEIKRLTAALDTIKSQIKANGAGDFSGFEFTAKVTESTRETIDWKSIAAKLNPSHQLITAHTTRAIIQAVKFSKI